MAAVQLVLDYLVGPTYCDHFTHSYSTLERNMYLAEDRILCFEIVTKKREGWVYVFRATIFFVCLPELSQLEIRQKRESLD